ncbi:hypothetical protein ACHAWF_014947 [Thalassiosira exigua]
MLKSYSHPSSMSTSKTMRLLAPLFIVFSLSHLAPAGAAVAKSTSGKPATPDDGKKKLSDALTDLEEATKKAEDLRARLQAHVESQVNKLLANKDFQRAANAGTGGAGGFRKIEVSGAAAVAVATGGAQKLELKIDLPADLAALVNSGTALKIQQSFGRIEGGELESRITLTQGVNNDQNGDKNGDGKDEGGDKGKDEVPQIEGPASSASGATSSATLCPLGTYSNTGFSTTNYECEPCPEGMTTLRLGSVSCMEVTKEDVLGMFYDLMNGNSWSAEQRKGWKSNLPACQWEGVSCNEDGKINGFSFPVVGLHTDGYIAA